MSIAVKRGIAGAELLENCFRHYLVIGGNLCVTCLTVVSESNESNSSYGHCLLIRIIGFRRVPPTAGRKLNFIEEILKLKNSRNATGIAFISPGML